MLTIFLCAPWKFTVSTPGHCVYKAFANSLTACLSKLFCTHSQSKTSVWCPHYCGILSFPWQGTGTAENLDFDEVYPPTFWSLAHIAVLNLSNFHLAQSSDNALLFSSKSFSFKPFMKAYDLFGVNFYIMKDACFCLFGYPVDPAQCEKTFLHWHTLAPSQKSTDHCAIFHSS